MDVIQHFRELQSRLLAFYRVNATSRFIALEKPKMRFHVLEAGAGEPLVLLHGGDGEGVNWAPIMAPLQEHARLYAVDRPGFGLSDRFDYHGVNLRQHAVDFVVSVLDSLGLASANLVGGSMGGFFALAASLARPDRVRHLILVGYAAGATRRLPLSLRLICGIPGLARRFMRGRPTLEAQKKQYQRMFHVDLGRVPDLYLETRIAGIQLPSEQGTWAELLPRIAGLAGIRKSVYLGDELPNIRLPTLMVMGEHDMAPPSVGRAIMARVPGGRFEYLPGVGHFPFLEVPAKTAQLIISFLRESSV